MDKMVGFLGTLKNMGKALRTCLQKLWIIGALFKARLETIKIALYEFTYMFIWSALPFMLGALVLYVTSDDTHKDYFKFIRDTFDHGELLIATISMLAPTLFVTVYDPEDADKFPHKLPIATITTLIAVISSALFALSKATVIKDDVIVLDLSIVLTCIALICTYLAILYNKVRLPIIGPSDLRQQQVAFVNEFREHVEGGADKSANAFADKFAQHIGGQE